jgi:hypothetical protein
VLFVFTWENSHVLSCPDHPLIAVIDHDKRRREGRGQEALYLQSRLEEERECCRCSVAMFVRQVNQQQQPPLTRLVDLFFVSYCVV